MSLTERLDMVKMGEEGAINQTKNTLMQLPHGSLSMTFEKSWLIKIKPKTLTLPGSP